MLCDIFSLFYHVYQIGSFCFTPESKADHTWIWVFFPLSVMLVKQMSDSFSC